jgi:hypothetical protein
MSTKFTELIEPYRSDSAEVNAAAREAGAIGGVAGDEHLDPARRPLIEAGEGEAEGFELAEQALIDAAESGDPEMDPMRNPFSPEAESPETSVYGEADHEDSTEVRDRDS